ncbi:hypothetical protein JCM8547_008569 [Rhodosporidiobolus lusitaniae]
MSTAALDASSSSLGLGRPSSGKASSRHPRQSSGAYQVFDPAQVQTFREAFSLIDQDNDGVISEEDLRGLLTSLGTPPTPAQLSSFLSSASLSHTPSGQPGVSFTTFVSLLASRLSELDGESELLEAFASFDETNSGYVKAEEVRRALGEEGREGERMSGEEISRLLHPPFYDPRTGLFNYRAFCATLRVTDPEEEAGGAVP